MTQNGSVSPGHLRARRALIDTYQQPVVYMRSDCDVCRAEGFEAQAQVEVVYDGHQAPATLHRVDADWLGHDEVALSEAAWNLLGLQGGEEVRVNARRTVGVLPSPVRVISSVTSIFKRSRGPSRRMASSQTDAIRASVCVAPGRKQIFIVTLFRSVWTN